MRVKSLGFEGLGFEGSRFEGLVFRVEARLSDCLDSELWGCVSWRVRCCSGWRRLWFVLENASIVVPFFWLAVTTFPCVLNYPGRKEGDRLGASM